MDEANIYKNFKYFHNCTHEANIYKNFEKPEINISSTAQQGATNPVAQVQTAPSNELNKDAFFKKIQASKDLLTSFSGKIDTQEIQNISLDTLTTLGAYAIGNFAKKGITLLDTIIPCMQSSKNLKSLKVLNVAIPFAASFVIRPVLNGLNNLIFNKNEKKKNNLKSNLANGISASLMNLCAPLAPLGFMLNAFVNFTNENKENVNIKSFMEKHKNNLIPDLIAFSALVTCAYKGGKGIDEIKKVIDKVKVNATSYINYTMPEDSLTQFQSLARDLGFDIGILINKETGKVDFSQMVKLDEELMGIILEKGQDGNIEHKMKRIEEMNIFLPKYFQTVMDIPDDFQEKLCRQIDEIAAGREAQKNKSGWDRGGSWATNYALDEAFKKFDEKNWSVQGLKDYQAIIQRIKSNCPASRTVDEAQQIIDESYGKGIYTIIRGGKKDGLLGVGSIAESYVAKDKDGKEVVVKLLKNQFSDGTKVAKDKEALLQKIEEKSDIREGIRISFRPQKHTITSREHQTYDKNLIENMCQVWEKETDLSQEAISAGQIKAQATKYQAIEPIASKKHIFVMEKAKGIQLDSEDIGKQWREAGLDEQDFSNFVDNYIAAYCEQLFSLPKNGEKVVQSDPHGGNILVDLAKVKGLKNAETTPITIIDYGNTIKTSQQNAVRNLFNHIDYLFGNTDLIAKNLLAGADLNGKNLNDTIRDLSGKLKYNIFNCDTKIDTKNPIEIFRATNDFCIEYMRKNNIIPNATNINQMKAEETYILSNLGCLKRIADECGYDISKAIDKKRIIKQLMKEMSQSTFESLRKNPFYTIKELSARVKFIVKNPEVAFSCLNLNFELFS